MRGLILVLLLLVSVFGEDLSPEVSESALGHYVRSIVFGGLDGIVTTFALCSGGEGAHMSVRVTLILGTSNLFADAVSMAFGDYLSTRAEYSHRKAVWHSVDTSGDGGVDLLKHSLQNNGLSADDALSIVATLSKSPDALKRAIMAELNVPRAEDAGRNAAALNGLVTLVAFISFGSVPLLAYTFSGGTGDRHFARAIVLTAVTLFLLGCFESLVTHQSMLVTGLETLVTGLLAATIAYAIGSYVGGAGESPAPSPAVGRRGAGKKTD